MPVLVVAGALDDKFAALARRMAGSIGDNATLALIEGAGHAAHLEQPERFLAVLRPWLDAHGL
jgi:pimeloyl-ACP methyl ester carboxylesterase